MVRNGIKKAGFNISCDGTPDWKKESSINKNEEKCTAEGLCIIADNGSRVVATHLIFFFLIHDSIII